MEEHYNQTWVKLKRPWTRQGEPYNAKKRIYGNESAMRINTQPYPFNPPPFAKDFSLGYDPDSYDSLKDRWKYHDSSFRQHHTPIIGMAPVVTHAPPPPITPPFALGSTSSTTQPKHARSSSDPTIGLSGSSPLFTPSKPPVISSGSGPSTPFSTPKSTPGSGPSGTSATYLQALQTPTSFTPKKTLAVQFLEFKGLSNTTGGTATQFITNNKKLNSEYKRFCERSRLKP